MTTRKRPDSKSRGRGQSVSARADDWIRQFTKHLELNFLDAGRGLPADAGLPEFQRAAARAILATLEDSGLEVESALELLGQAAVQDRCGGPGWSDALNERRFALMDKDIQGTLTAAERGRTGRFGQDDAGPRRCGSEPAHAGGTGAPSEIAGASLRGALGLIFDYPEREGQRRHGPAGYAEYESYRPWLRDEFDCRCEQRRILGLTAPVQQRGGRAR